MAYQTLKVEVEAPLAVVTFNRPEKLNALNDQLVRELIQAWDELEAREDVRVVLFTGAGEKAFVAGADINELSRLDPLAARRMSDRMRRLARRMETSPKVTIAAINGYALGGGCEFAMICDIRIAAENARLGQPEVKLGIIPGYGGTQRLPRLVGKGQALRLILSGEMIPAREAYEIGLVDQVVEAGKALEAAKELGRAIAARGPVAVALAKQAVHRGCDMPLDEALEYEATLFGLVLSTEDAKEGTRAFLEKREPNFQGR